LSELRNQRSLESIGAQKRSMLIYCPCRFQSTASRGDFLDAKFKFNQIKVDSTKHGCGNRRELKYDSKAKGDVGRLDAA